MSVDMENLKKLLEDCKKVNCEYVKKHNELKEVITNYKNLAKDTQGFELFNTNIVN